MKTILNKKGFILAPYLMIFFFIGVLVGFYLGRYVLV